MAFMAVIMGSGLLIYVLLGFRYGLGLMVVSGVVCAQALGFVAAGLGVKGFA